MSTGFTSPATTKQILSNKWNQYRNRQPKGFILDFSNLLQRKIPNASKDAIELVALVNLSSVCGNVTHSNLLGDIKPNIFCLIIGPSGLAYKTKLMVENGSDLIKQISDDLVFPSRFSIEGAVEYIAGRREDQVNGEETVTVIVDNHPFNTMYRDEFTGLVKEKDKAYLSDIPEFISELYNGLVQKRYTKSCKLENCDKTFFSMISVTTPALYEYLPTTYFSQGLGNRFIYVVISPEDLRPAHYTYPEFFGAESKRLMNEGLNELLANLKKMSGSSLKTMEISEEAGTLWLEYREDKERLSIAMARIDQVSPRGAYVNRIPGNAMKLAMLHRISRFISDDLSIGRDFEEISIELEDMEWAIGRMENAFEHFNTMINEWQMDTQKDEENARLVEMVNVSKAIERSVDRWLLRKELIEMPEIFKNSKTAYDIIKKMIETEYLEEFDIGSKSAEELNRHGVKQDTSNKGAGLRIGSLNPWALKGSQVNTSN